MANKPLTIEAHTADDELAVYLTHGARSVELGIIPTLAGAGSREWLEELADVLGRRPDPFTGGAYARTPIELDGKRLS